LLPLLGVLDIIGLVVPKAGQVIIAQINAIIAIILGVITALMSILGIFGIISDALSKLKKKSDDQTMKNKAKAEPSSIDKGEESTLSSTATGGSWDYNFEWTDSNGSIIGTEQEVTVAPQKTTTYSCKATDKENGEVQSDTVKVKVSIL